MVLSAAVLPVGAATQIESESGESLGIDALGNTERVLEQVQNNSTRRHVNPDEVDSEGDQAQLREHLASQLASRLEESSIELEDGEYEQAEETLGDDYSELLAKYVEVSGDGTQGSSKLNETRTQQREYVQTVQEYRETYAEYQKAKRAGNEEKARQLARELDRLDREINSTSTSLTDSYETLENETSANFTGETTQVNATQQNISSQQTRVRQSEFVRTSLSVTAGSNETSYLDPLPISGRLTAADGSPVANQNVTLEFGTQTVQAETDSEGRFSTQLRPQSLSATDSKIAVQYVPQTNSTYYGTNTTISATVRPVEAKITFADVPETLSYGENVTLSGTVTAEGRPVSDAPVRLMLQNSSLATVRTNETGAFNFSTSMPANASSGEAAFAAQLGYRGSALTSNTTAVLTTIERTETQIQFNLTRDIASQAQLSGRLETQGGNPVSNQEILVRFDGSVLTTVTTDENGEFDAEITLPASDDQADAEQTQQLAVEFQGTGTNLRDVRAEKALPPVAGAEGGNSNSFVLIGVGATIILIVGGLFFGQRWLRAERQSQSETTATENPEIADNNSQPSTVDRLEESESVLSLARDALQRGDADVAVELGYMGIRHRLSAQFGLEKQQTHWEYYGRVKSEHGKDVDMEKFRALTAAYETAAYTRNGVSTDSAADAFDAIESILSDSPQHSQND
ncbi:hypothetical protein AUR64_14260 [Haloprofundus marisrubri]|uniref:Protein-glutamine gamma-glutamyltransferase-like C-terminal domain-containing protein n=1 Tax=Haloprofundus marisrubri TaxID=1514971 RepID=A0A0W1R6A6_9EURY|nr:hypothetical protein AUR64_14260 [Haloprofundus marisrubri]